MIPEIFGVVKVTLFWVITIATILLVTQKLKGFFRAVFLYQLKLLVVAQFGLK